MSRLSSTFQALRDDRRPGLVTYVTAGDPDRSRSADVLRALDRAGADVIEVGVPFSDPVADGPVIQRASERALAAGGSLLATLDLVGGVRREIRAPIVLFTYANPVFRLGAAEFAEAARRAGVDGVLVLDLPIEEAGRLHGMLAGAGMDMIVLLSPTTTDARIEAASRVAGGFVYAISRLGVTGARDSVPAGARSLVARIRARISLPVAVGFGISTRDHVREVGGFADAAVVGSALVALVAQARERPDVIARIEQYVGWLAGRHNEEVPWLS